jgi:hypothetical protein
MITSCDSVNTVDLGQYYAILPSGGDYDIDTYCAETGGNKVAEGFSYNSGKNDDFLTVEQLRELISTHVTSKA